MAAGDLALNILINGNAGGANAAIRSVSGALSMLASGNVIGAVVTAAAAVGVAIVGIGIASVKMAGDYEQGMNKVQALTGSSQQQMAQYDAGLKQLAVTAGVAPTALTDGLYNVLSASYKGATAMQVLTLATEDAKIGMTSATITTDALTNILRSFGVKTQDITRVNGEMLQTVTLGKATFEQYATTIVKSASAAVQFHVSMETMNAAWATMTSSGIRAAQASTDFQQSLKVMYGNINTVTASLHKNGIAFDETKFNAMDYGHKVEYLNTALEQANAKHVKITGVTLQAAQAITAISKHINDYNSNLATLSDKQAMAQKTQQAWAITQGGFNQTMDRLHASLDVLMITIGQKLLPVFTQIASNLLPVIQGFGNWITSGDKVGGVVQRVGNFIKSDLLPPALQIARAFMDNVVPAVQHLGAVVMPLVNGFITWTVKSGALHNALGFIGDVISTIVSGIGGLINGIANVIGFFSQNQAAALALLIPLGALGGYFVFLGVSAVASFIAAAPAMIAGFITGAAAAWTMAAGVIAATWPFLLIGAAIGLVIIIIVLLVQHWGQVVSFLRGVWAGFSSWFMGALGAVGNFFSGVWNGIISFLKAAWAFILNVIKIGAITVLVLMTWPFLAVAALFIWLYNHNTYFKMLIDAIVGFVKNGVKWLTDLWTGIVNWIVGKWNYLHAMATVYFTMLYYVIYSKILQVQNFVHGILVTIGNFFIDRWNTLVTNTTALWNKISGIFSSAWNTYIAGPLGSLWNSISGWFKQLGQGALDSGKNFIQMLVNGITSGAGAIWNAVTGIAKNIWSALGFHSPTEAGPGRDADRWMPNLINMLVSGLNAGVPAMHRAALNVAAPLAQLSGGGSFALSGAHAGNAFALSGSNGSAFALGNGGQTIVIQVQPATANITMDHRKVGEGVMKYAQREVHLQGSVRNK